MPPPTTSSMPPPTTSSIPKTTERMAVRCVIGQAATDKSGAAGERTAAPAADVLIGVRDCREAVAYTAGGAHHSKTVAELQEAIANLKKTIAGQQGTIADQKGTIEELQEAITYHKNRKQAYRGLWNKQKLAHEDTEGELGTSKCKEAELEASLRDLKTAVDDLAKRNEVLRTQNHEYLEATRQHAGLRRANRALQAQVEQLTEERDNALLNKAVAAGDTVPKSTYEDFVKTGAKEFQDRIDKLITRQKELIAQLVDSRRRVVTLEDENSGLQKSYQTEVLDRAARLTSRETIMEYETRLLQKEEAIAQHQCEKQELANTLGDLRTEKDTLAMEMQRVQWTFREALGAAYKQDGSTTQQLLDTVVRMQISSEAEGGSSLGRPSNKKLAVQWARRQCRKQIADLMMCIQYPGDFLGEIEEKKNDVAALADAVYSFVLFAVTIPYRLATDKSHPEFVKALQERRRTYEEEGGYPGSS